MPNQRPSVAAYWSTDVLGRNRPCPDSSGPLLAIVGSEIHAIQFRISRHQIPGFTVLSGP
jgi:hypothetical protein